jgi:ERCC4-related helicase
LRVLREIQELWKTIDRDPKVESFKQYLSEEKELQKGKLLIFTESAETAKYL